MIRGAPVSQRSQPPALMSSGTGWLAYSGRRRVERPGGAVGAPCAGRFAVLRVMRSRNARGTSERTQRLWRALGFADVDDDDVVFTESDVEALRLMNVMVGSGLLDPSRSGRRPGGRTGPARLAEWELGLLNDYVRGARRRRRGACRPGHGTALRRGDLADDGAVALLHLASPHRRPHRSSDGVERRGSRRTRWSSGSSTSSATPVWPAGSPKPNWAGSSIGSTPSPLTWSPQPVVEWSRRWGTR